MAPAISLDAVSMKFTLHHQRAMSFQDALVNFVHRRNGGTEEFWALRNVSFVVEPGETLGIIGTNGSGKSTILKLVTRILDPTSGKVAVDGRVSALIELGAGFHPDLTGRENIYLNGSIMGFGRKEMDRRFDEILAFSELERFIDTPVKHFSSGMYTRLGFSVATSVDPDILIIDEVLSVGDAAFQHKCMDRIDEFRRRGKTIIFVSHAMGSVERLCDRVVWIEKGVARAVGPALHTIRQYEAAVRQHEDEARAADQQLSNPQPSTATILASAKPSPSIEVLDTRARTIEGHEQYSFPTGSPVVVSVRYHICRPVAIGRYSITVRRSDGLLVYQSTKVQPWLGSSDVPGTQIVELAVQAVGLLPGSYDVVPWISDADDQHAHVPAESSGCRISIWNNSVDAGVVSLEHYWRQASVAVESTIESPALV